MRLLRRVLYIPLQRRFTEGVAQKKFQAKGTLFATIRRGRRGERGGSETGRPCRWIRQRLRSLLSLCALAHRRHLQEQPEMQPVPSPQRDCRARSLRRRRQWTNCWTTDIASEVARLDRKSTRPRTSKLTLISISSSQSMILCPGESVSDKRRHNNMRAFTHAHTRTRTRTHASGWLM